jgi:hypothetical protein
MCLITETRNYNAGVELMIRVLLASTLLEKQTLQCRLNTLLQVSES